MFKVNYRDIANQITPHFMRKSRFRSKLYSMIAPLSSLNDNGTPIQFFNQKDTSFYHFTEFITNFIHFDARTIYLEHYLNDRYDPTDRGILITNNNTTADVIYLYNLEENADPVYFYNNWDVAVSYLVANLDRVIYKGILYVAAQNSTGVIPLGNPTQWADEGVMQYAFNVSDEFTADYTVEVPILVTQQPDYSNPRIQAQINLFNAAGRSYEGVIKEIPSTILFTKT